MVKCGWLVCSIVLWALSIQFVYSQSTTLTNLRVTEVYAEKDYETGSLDNEYRWKVWFEEDPEVCIQLTREDPGWFAYNHTLASNFYIPNLPASTLTLRMEGWEEDGCGGECSYNTGVTCVDDEGHCSANDQYLSIGDYPPGKTNSVVLWACASGNPYAIRYEFSYLVPIPQVPTVSAPSGQICEASPFIQLSSTSYINAAYLSSTGFLWEYWSTASAGWRSLATTTANVNSGRYSFTNIRLLSAVSGITTNVQVFFRVRTRYTDSNGISHFSGYTNSSSAINISPLPPTIGITSTEPSCPGQSTGKITVNVTGMGNYRYILRAGENTSPCNPEAGNCGGSKSGSASGTSFEITGVPKGRYTLIVSNFGGTAGVCWNYRYVDVGEIPVLQMQPPAITSVTCHGGSDGTVELTAAGGITPWEYTLTKNSFSASNSSGEFNSLMTGNYTGAVSDGCGQLATIPVAISEPLNILASSSPVSPSCSMPANGAVQVNVTQGEGTYSFKITGDNTVVSELNNAETNTWTVGNLPAGSYTIEIKDAERLQCEGFTQPVSLALPKSLEIVSGNIVKTDLTCFEQNDGSIQLNNADVSGDLQYVLTRQSLDVPRTLSTTSKFENLPAGNYALAVRRTVPGCEDQFNFPDIIDVYQPARRSITLDKHDISCYGRTDGKITAIITGQTPSDSYQWEIKLGTSWATMNSLVPSLENLSEGIYRMKLNNANNCLVVSEEATVIEPGLLTIANVIKKDVACLGEKGEVEVIMNGGVVPYSYDFSSSSDVAHSASQKTLLATGSYTLLAKDGNGCLVNHPETLVITEPSVPLSFTHTLSDYNGFNISCAGASNGIADIAVTGGNAPGYTGYSYALDGVNFQASARLKNIPAGSHTISARDGRGCVVTKPVIFTQPAAQLVPELQSKNNIKCLGDNNGTLVVSVTGGVQPYSFILNRVLTQQTGTFSGLAPGDYTVTITDKNDCAAEYSDVITILTPPMEIALLKTDVSCHDGTNGAVEAEVSGGALPLQYTWKDIQKATSGVSGLRAGTYTLRVNDQQGCVQEKSITILQPEALTVKITAIPVCVGKANGEIWLQAGGGTPSYSYSVNGGAVYQQEPIFKSIAAGIHDVLIKDQNNCLLPASAEVIVRNDTPQPNFIVASKQNALDTLMVKEISVPKPDSVVWNFDLAITIVKQDSWSPEIMVPEAGTYDVSMTGYFGGCDYTNTLTITINPYDPEEMAGTSLPVKIIKSMTVTPNPSTGAFDVSVELHAKQRLSLSVIDVLGVVHYQENMDKTLSVTRRINITETISTSGVFVVRAVTNTDAQDIRIVIKH